jgi:hypothetical protein
MTFEFVADRKFKKLFLRDKELNACLEIRAHYLFSSF